MGISFDKALGVHPAALRLRSERTEILASNIANESTPGYKARDLDFRGRMASIADGVGSGLPLDDDDEPQYRIPHAPSRDGNTVEIGVEQAAFSQNVSDFQMSLTFVNMKLRGLSKAISG